MFSREESRQMRQLFWTSFGKSFPKKWILYHTKVKDCAFKFHFDTKKAMVCMDFESDNPQRQAAYIEKMESLKTLLLEYCPDAIFDTSYVLENHKEIFRIYVLQTGVCIHNKNTWQQTMEFLYEQMQKLEAFFIAYKEVIEIQ